MAGHSKWANIKHRKARQDAKRGAVFTKIIRELPNDLCKDSASFSILSCFSMFNICPFGMSCHNYSSIFLI